MEQESCSRNHEGGIIKEEHGGGIMEEETWRRNHGGGIMQEKSCRGAARSSQEQPGTARSRQEQTGAARSSQEQPGAARSSQMGSWLQMLPNLISQKGDILDRKLRVIIVWKFAGAARSSQEESLRRHLRGIWEGSGRRLGVIWRREAEEASGRQMEVRSHILSLPSQRNADLPSNCSFHVGILRYRCVCTDIYHDI